MAMSNAAFIADCASCCALCCVAPAFDAEQGFGYDKPAHIPCTNLLDNYRCEIHDTLSNCGFGGCAVYTCHGAGQWVTQVMFNGASWHDSAETAQAMFAAFSRQKVLHELMFLLHTALQHIADSTLRQLLGAKLLELEELSSRAESLQCSPTIAEVKESSMELLRSLRGTSESFELKSLHSKNGPAR